MIKLIASDLDGTIINGHGQCSPATVKTIAKLREEGIQFAICSGRPVSSVLPLVEGWGLKDVSDFIIGSNGGEVLETSTGRMVRAYTLDADLIKEIIDLYEPLGLIPTLYGEGDTLYIERITPTAEKMAKRVAMKLVQADIRSMTTKSEIKEMMVVEPEDMEKVEAFYNDHQDFRYIGFKTAHDLFEFNHPLLAKDVGVRILGAKLHLDPEEMMAFGDTTNDVDMLKYVKYGVAMSNGTQDAKDVAYAIADSVDEDGFSKYLEKHLVHGEVL